MFDYIHTLGKSTTGAFLFYISQRRKSTDWELDLLLVGVCVRSWVVGTVR